MELFGYDFLCYVSTRSLLLRTLLLTNWLLVLCIDPLAAAKNMSIGERVVSGIDSLATAKNVSIGERVVSNFKPLFRQRHPNRHVRFPTVAPGIIRDQGYVD